jgi:hypothetical protein
VTEVFAKMLLRLKWLSVDIPQTIAMLYPTARDLMEATPGVANAMRWRG